MKKKYVLTEEQAIMLFNVLDELYQVEDMSWARLGNFEDMTVVEFKEFIRPLIDALNDAN
jgi:hypothetical protein